MVNIKTPYTVTSAAGGAHLALATVGALPADHGYIQPWNPFARNATAYRNIILIAHDADAELRFLTYNPRFFFNPYGFCTVGAVFDCQRLYMMLHPTERNKRKLEFLIEYCFPKLDITTLHLHNGGKYCLSLDVTSFLFDSLLLQYRHPSTVVRATDAFCNC